MVAHTIVNTKPLGLRAFVIKDTSWTLMDTHVLIPMSVRPTLLAACKIAVTILEATSAAAVWGTG